MADSLRRWCRPHSPDLGKNHGTRDGFCVRYSVLDLANPHTRAVEHLLNNDMSHALNLGTELCGSVKELLEIIQLVAGGNSCIKYEPVAKAIHQP